MPSTPDDSRSFGLRYEDMNEEEREYYREFWQEPKPRAGEVGYRLPEQDAVRARSRMATGLSFILLMLGILLTLISTVAGHTVLAILCSLIVVAGLGLLVAVRRRLFKSLRVKGQGPLTKNKKAKWLWLPHGIALTGVACAVVSLAVIPQVFAEAEPIVLRTHILIWNELTMLCLLVAALFYGLISLAIYTPEDYDESIVRPTDFAEQQIERDINRSKNKDDFYDSSWITGKDR